MLVLFAAVSLAFILLVLQKTRTRTDDIQQWIDAQIRVATFSYAGEPGIAERLQLRASENRRLTAAFGIDNSLTTGKLSVHKAFIKRVSQLLTDNRRSWEKLYRVALSFLEAEIWNSMQTGRNSLPLAECVRCMVLTVVLFDSFGVDPASIPRADLVIITDEINKQWLQSKCDPNVAPSRLLNRTIDSLNLKSPSQPADKAGPTMTPEDVLSLIMPQYETLWRVVLLTFVTAYHHQPGAYPDAAHRTRDVPACLGDRAREEEALKLAKVCHPRAP